MLKQQLCFHDYLEYDKIPNSIGIVGFHPTEWRVGDISKAHNIVYLIKTLASLEMHVDQIILYVCVEGFEFIGKLFDNVQVKMIDVPEEIEGHVSGDKTVRPVPKYALLENEWHNYEFVFFTEADHVIYSKNLNSILNEIDNSQYLAAHRFEQKYQKYNQQGQPITQFNNQQYVLYNDWEKEFNHYNANLMTANTYRASYSAAWIARSSALKNVNFNRFEKKALGSPCISVFDTLQCLKTKNRFSFFVDHLSGFDNALKEGGLHIKIFPGKW